MTKLDKDPGEMLKEITDDLERKLGIPVGSLKNLISKGGGDWRFIIEAHLLLEAAATHLLVKTLKKPQLEKVFLRLPMSDSRIGKMVFVRELGLLRKHWKLIKMLSEIRNKFVHNISYIAFRFEDYISDNKKEREFVNNLRGCLPFDDEWILKNPAFAVWWTVIVILADIYS